jgi:paired amphipathic helix protein Sin3a
MNALGADPKSDSFPPQPLPVTDSEPAADGTPTQASSQDHPAPYDNTALGNKLLARFLGAKNEEKLILRIAVNNYHPLFQPGSYEGFFEDLRQREGGEQGVKEAEETRGVRHEVMREKYVMNNLGMKGLSREEVEKRNEDFRLLANGEVKADGEAGGDGGEAEGEGMEVDG